MDTTNTDSNTGNTDSNTGNTDSNTGKSLDVFELTSNDSVESPGNENITQDLGDSVAVTRLQSTPGNVSDDRSGFSTENRLIARMCVLASAEPRKERWNIIARAIKTIKTKLHHGNEDAAIPYMDETDEGVVSGSAESLGEGRATVWESSCKESQDTSDAEDCSRVNKGVHDAMRTGKEETPTHTTVDTPVKTRKRKRPTKPDDDVKASPEHNDDPKSRALPEAMKNNLAIILSGIYGLTVVVIGLVLPLSEIFVNSDHPYFFEVFYLYLYLVSMLFLAYMYAFLLRKDRLFSISLPKNISKTLTRTTSHTSLKSGVSEPSASPTKPLVRHNSTLSSLSIRRRRKIAYNREMSAHTGSFYLRVGVIGFGVGSMIHSGLTFGHYFEVSHFANHCSNALQAIKPLALLGFTFVQMYFIFMNSKMCIHKYKTLARFGLMHLSCTNICVWLRSLVIETLLVIKINNRKSFEEIIQTSEDFEERREEDRLQEGATPSGEEFPDEDQAGFITELSCNLDAMMGKIIESSSVYLYPCTIEYSLVCACVLYVMWSNVGEGRTATRAESCSDFGALDSEDDSEEDNGKHRMSVDCAGSSRGLFLGILLFVVAVVCVVCFYVLTSASSHVTTGTLLGHICEEIILIVTFVATAIASFQMREMHFSVNQGVGIEEILTLISICGLGLYGVWSITAALFYLDTLHGRLTIITNMLMLIQAGSQATFTFVALRVSAKTSEQLRTKPGRECVTFLLICNFALWMINSFETQRLEHNQTQVDFYGTTAWSIFSHISVPLGIYYRFHSTVNLSIVWKKAWKKDAEHEIQTCSYRRSRTY